MKLKRALPLLIFVCGLLASALTPPAAGAPYHALVIGNDEYTFLPKVGTAAKDARAVERMLRETYGFQTRLLVNAGRSEMVAALSAYGRESGADASLLISYAPRGREGLHHQVRKLSEGERSERHRLRAEVGGQV